MASNIYSIITRVFKPEEADFTPDMAHKILTWQFAEQDHQRASELLNKNNAGTLTKDEREELETLAVFGDLLSILHAKARLSLHHYSGV